MGIYFEDEVIIVAARAPTIPKTSKAAPVSMEEQIRQRAYEIYLQRGGQDGSDLDDWLQAEAEILRHRKNNFQDIIFDRWVR